MKRKMILTVLTGAMISGSVLSVSAKDVADFQDVKTTDWYYSSVKDMAEVEIMTGLTDTTFGPNREMGRGQFATILYRMAGSPETSFQQIYPDVPDGQFYSLPAVWTNQEGFLTGYADGRMGAADNITREQLVTILYRAEKLYGGDVSGKADLTTFKDWKKVSPFAQEAIEWAVSEGIVKGEGTDGTLNPQGNVSRAVGAALLSRFLFGE